MKIHMNRYLFFTEEIHKVSVWNYLLKAKDVAKLLYQTICENLFANLHEFEGAVSLADPIDHEDPAFEVVQEPFFGILSKILSEVPGNSALGGLFFSAEFVFQLAALLQSPDPRERAFVPGIMMHIFNTASEHIQRFESQTQIMTSVDQQGDPSPILKHWLKTRQAVLQALQMAFYDAMQNYDQSARSIRAVPYMISLLHSLLELPKAQPNGYVDEACIEQLHGILFDLMVPIFHSPFYYYVEPDFTPMICDACHAASEKENFDFIERIINRLLRDAAANRRRSTPNNQNGLLRIVSILELLNRGLLPRSTLEKFFKWLQYHLRDINTALDLKKADLVILEYLSLGTLSDMLANLCAEDERHWMELLEGVVMILFKWYFEASPRRDKSENALQRETLEKCLKEWVQYPGIIEISQENAAFDEMRLRFIELFPKELAVEELESDFETSSAHGSSASDNPAYEDGKNEDEEADRNQGYDFDRGLIEIRQNFERRLQLSETNNNTTCMSIGLK